MGLLAGFWLARLLSSLASFLIARTLRQSLAFLQGSITATSLGLRDSGAACTLLLLFLAALASAFILLTSWGTPQGAGDLNLTDVLRSGSDWVQWTDREPCYCPLRRYDDSSPTSLEGDFCWSCETFQRPLCNSADDCPLPQLLQEI